MNKYYGIAEAEPEIKIKRRTGQLSTVNVFSHGTERVSLTLGEAHRARLEKLEKIKKGKNDKEDIDEER